MTNEAPPLVRVGRVMAGEDLVISDYVLVDPEEEPLGWEKDEDGTLVLYTRDHGDIFFADGFWKVFRIQEVDETAVQATDEEDSDPQ